MVYDLALTSSLTLHYDSYMDTQRCATVQRDFVLYFIEYSKKVHAQTNINSLYKENTT